MNTTQETTHSTGNIHVEIHFLFGWFASVKATQSQWVGKMKESKESKQKKKKNRIIFLLKMCVW